MSIDQKILKELDRYNRINKYIMEQAEPLPPADPAALPADPAAAPADPAAAPAPAAPAPPTPPAEEGKPVDVATDPDVEEIGGEDEEVEELDITDLVDTQSSIADKQEEYFNNLFDQLNKMQEKLGEMDQIVGKID